MSSVSIWLLSIVGIIIIAVIVEIIMPEGQMNKYIKSVLAIVTVFVVVLPLTKISLDKIDFGSFFNESEAVSIDNHLLDNINNQKKLEYERVIEKLLNDNGYKNVKVTVDIEKTAAAKIKSVQLDLSGLVLANQTLNINKNEAMTNIIVNSLDVKKEQILFKG